MSLLEKYRYYNKARLILSLALSLLVSSTLSSAHQLEHLDEYDHEPSHVCEICLYFNAIDNALENSSSLTFFEAYGLNSEPFSYNHYRGQYLKQTRARAPPVFT